MWKNNKIILIVMIILSLCSFTPASSINGSAIIPVGRTRLVKQGLELITSAAHFSVQFTGDSCKVGLALAENSDAGYIQYEVDGKYEGKMKITKGPISTIVFSAHGERKHLLTIYKTTEASSGGIIVSEVQGTDIRAIVPKKRPLIEFIGNSITSGAASDISEIPCGAGAYGDHHNAYMAYGPRVARALNCEFVVASVSGIGCYRNWNSDGPTMPQVYESRSLNSTDTSRWDFSQFTPDIISCALGTNDMSGGDGKTPRAAFDPEKFVTTFVAFVARLKNIHPGVKIALLNAAGKKDAQKVILETCLSRIKDSIDVKYPKDRPVALIYFKQLVPRGCNGHPSVDDHAMMADDVIPAFKSLLK